MIRKIAAISVALGMVWSSATIGAQEGESSEDRVQRQVERRMRDLQRSLQLSEAQMEKIKPLVTSYEKQQQELREKNDQQIKQILTPDQTQQMDSRRSRRGRGGSSRGGSRFGPSQILGRLRQELDLTQDQETKMEAIFEKASEEMRTMFSRAREGGFQNMDWGKMQESMRKYWSELSDEVRKHLNESQIERYDEMVKEMENNPWMRGFRGRSQQSESTGRQGNDRSGREGREGREGRRERDASGQAERRYARALESLNLDDEEAAIVGPMVRAIVDLQTTGRKSVQTVRQQLESLLEGKSADEAQLQGAIDALRQVRTQHESKLSQAREELRSLLTLPQEGQMLGQGILD
ncbi:MAG: hypothetical protein QF752_14040 [Planctomycetota bacterium]|nr:hypothetical protein [Planctomycetota bacterium]